MIVGLVGPICSGKGSLAQYLVDKYGFEAINILDIFRQRITEIENQRKKNSETKSNEKSEEHIEEEQDEELKERKLKMQKV